MKDKFPALDAFRGVAALLVFVMHTSDYWKVSVPRVPIAVDLFFILSGFVVAHAYEARLASGVMSFRCFFLIRVIRLYPMYLLAVLTALLGIVSALHRSEHVILEHVWAGLAAIFFVPAHVSYTPYLYPPNIVCWSLLFELIVNFLYAGLRKWLTNSVLVVIAVSAGLALAFMVYVSQPRAVDLGPLWGALQFWGGLARAVFGMSAGVLLYRHYRAVPAWLVGRGGHRLALLLIAIALCGPSLGRADWLLQLFAVFVLFPWCVLSGVRAAGSAGGRLLVTLGVISYPVYVLQEPLLHIASAVAGDRLTRFAPVSGIGLTLLLIGVAIVVEKRVDRPVRRWLTDRLIGRAQMAPPSADGLSTGAIS